MSVYLNVAEKPSVARAILNSLGNNQARTLATKSTYNKVNEFRYNIKGEEVIMRLTSVTGHVMEHYFTSPEYKRNWNQTSPGELFDADITKQVSENAKAVAENLKFHMNNVTGLILWLDCDSEGENIACEVINLCQGNRPLQIYRAHFSDTTTRTITRAVQNLTDVNYALSESVEARIELDLRLGSIFTRYQTVLLQNLFKYALGRQVISYGPCQTPTLGFVVRRWQEIEEFVPRDYWSLEVKHTKEEMINVFEWIQGKSFEFAPVEAIYKASFEVGEATIVKVEENPKEHYRPYPLNTVQFQKLSASKLRIPSATAMDIAEKLYQKGKISYPRTETNFFNSNINVKELVQKQTDHPDWGPYADALLHNDRFVWPKKGKSDDKSHPPIHPVFPATRGQLENDEWRVYELITRHFLAVCSPNAKGRETANYAQIGDEQWVGKGLVIDDIGYMEVYPYVKWENKAFAKYTVDEVFVPDELNITEHTTQPPPLLSESDLVSAMDKAGIGTDATIAQHIETIQKRNYAYRKDNVFHPTPLGIALVQGYREMGEDLSESGFRRQTEESMRLVAEGVISKEDMIHEAILKARQIYAKFSTDKQKLVDSVKKWFPDQDTDNKENNVWFICQQPGHLSENCPSKRGKPGARGGRGGNAGAGTRGGRQGNAGTGTRGGRQGNAGTGTRGGRQGTGARGGRQGNAGTSRGRQQEDANEGTAGRRNATATTRDQHTEGTT